MAATAIADRAWCRGRPGRRPGGAELAARAFTQPPAALRRPCIMCGPRGNWYHVDAIGHWVVLFNLSSDAAFHCGADAPPKVEKYGGLAQLRGLPRRRVQVRRLPCLLWCLPPPGVTSASRSHGDEPPALGGHG